ncbi:hypothetical protein F511_12762 [Dorcoceras hygrometricum]|uniref:Uncharacterized protein n=1 Tax=Dorcoceras hygrometricum TaxID=472368 RepID=A0A2Z7D6X2_9LAMI|nr:hypothetical protein F511_12762 [Dorcoceras hygrometricum]
MALLNKKNGYSKIQSGDPDEMKHRRAQFLIYKSLQKADTRRRPSWLKVRIFRLKIKIGKKLRKGFSIASFSAKTDLYRQIAGALKSWLQCKQDPIVTTNALPPLL